MFLLFLLIPMSFEELGQFYRQSLEVKDLQHQNIANYIVRVENLLCPVVKWRHTTFYRQKRVETQVTIDCCWAVANHMKTETFYNSTILNTHAFGPLLRHVYTPQELSIGIPNSCLLLTFAKSWEPFGNGEFGKS